VDAKLGGNRGFGAILGGSADFEGLAFKNLQGAFKWLFLFDSNAFKTHSITGIFPLLSHVYCELNCEQRLSASQLGKTI